MTRSFKVGLLLPCAFAAAASVRAHDGAGFDISVLVDGKPVPEYAGRGRIYIEALKGKEFTIRLSNPTSERVAVALSVDGRNVVDAKRTTELAASKWVLNPGQVADIPGWQISGETARKFFFTETSKSYAAWLGDTSNVGTIEAVFFREKGRDAITPLKDEPYAQRRPEEPAAAGAPSANARQKAQEADQYAATGIGDKTRFAVQWVAFEEDPTPAARIAIRYEYRPQLVRLGVFPRGDEELFARDHSRGFEQSYAPDPYVKR